MKRSADLERQHALCPAGSRAFGHALEGVARAGDDELARGIEIRHLDRAAVLRCGRARFTQGGLIQAKYRGHAAVDAGTRGCHGARAHLHQTQGGLGIQDARGNVRREFTDAVASHRGCLDATLFAQDGQGSQAGGHHRRLRHVRLGQPLQRSVRAELGDWQIGDLIGKVE